MENEANPDPGSLQDAAGLTDVAPAVTDAIEGATGWAQQLVETALRPWNFYQLAIIAGLLMASWLFRRWAGAQMHGWMRGLEGWPKWRLRALVLLHQRLQLIGFVVLAWLAYAAISYFEPARDTALLRLAATIGNAWLIVSLITRLVRNPFLRRITTWGLWIYVTLFYLGLRSKSAELLDSASVNVGDFHLSLLTIIKALVIVAVLFTLARLASRTISSQITGNDDISPSMQVLAITPMQVILFGAAFFIGLKAVGFDLTGLAVFSGAVGVGLGFGLQKVVSNLVSGVIILLDKSVKPGDVISLGDTFGWIDSLGARYVSVVTRDGKEYLIPNEDLITGQVVNWSHSNAYVRIDLDFGTSYGDDPHKVRAIAVEAAAKTPRVLPHDPRRPLVCLITGFGDSSVDYQLRFWIRDASGGVTNVKGAVYLALWDAFKEHGISIPFPQREVRVLNDTIAVGQSGPGKG